MVAFVTPGCCYLSLLQIAFPDVCTWGEAPAGSYGTGPLCLPPAYPSSQKQWPHRALRSLSSLPLSHPQPVFHEPGSASTHTHIRVQACELSLVLQPCGGHCPRPQRGTGHRQSTQICRSHSHRLLPVFHRCGLELPTPGVRASPAGITLRLAVTFPCAPGSLCFPKVLGDTLLSA